MEENKNTYSDLAVLLNRCMDIESVLPDTLLKAAQSFLFENKFVPNLEENVQLFQVLSNLKELITIYHLRSVNELNAFFWNQEKEILSFIDNLIETEKKDNGVQRSNPDISLYSDLIKFCNTINLQSGWEKDHLKDMVANISLISYKELFEGIVEELGKNLEVSQTLFTRAYQFYEFFKEWLANESPIFSKYSPKVFTYGSFVLGTQIKPIRNDNDVGIDLLCEFSNDERSMTYLLEPKAQNHFGNINYTFWALRDISIELKFSFKDIYKVQFNERLGNHLDLLLADAISLLTKNLFKTINFKILDEQEIHFLLEDNLSFNVRDNSPLQYCNWFYQHVSIKSQVKDVFYENKNYEDYVKRKMPLQRVIQILKYHRDLYFFHNEEKPSSMVITTLAAQVYNKEKDTLNALFNVINKLDEFVEDRYDEEDNKVIKWISNPINKDENLAEDWSKYPMKQERFYNWLEMLQKDFQIDFEQGNSNQIEKTLINTFGEEEVRKAIVNYVGKT